MSGRGSLGVHAERCFDEPWLGSVRIERADAGAAAIRASQPAATQVTSGWRHAFPCTIQRVPAVARPGSFPLALVLVLVALVPLAAVAILLALGLGDATTTLPVLVTFAWEPIADDINGVLAFTLPVSVALALQRLARLCHNLLCPRRAAREQAAEPGGRRRLQQPPSPGAGGTQFDEGIERLVVHGRSLLVASIASRSPPSRVGTDA